MIDNAIQTAELEDRVLKNDFYLSRGLFTVLNSSSLHRDIIVPNFNLYAIPNDYFSAIEKVLYNGTIPEKFGDVIAVASSSLITSSNLSSMGTFTGFTPMFGVSNEIVIDLGIPLGGMNLNVTGLLTYEAFSNFINPFTNDTSEYDLLVNDFNAMTSYFTENFFLTSYSIFKRYTSTLQYITGYAQAIGRVVFSLEKLNSFKIQSEISAIQRFSQELTREFNDNNFEAHIYTPIIGLLENFQKEFIMFQLFGILFITPVIGMALSLTSYSANLMKRTQKRQISSLLQRGASRQEVLFVLILQMIELTITALLISFIFGYGFTWLISKSVGFLNFAGIGFYPALNIVVLYVIIVTGFLLSIFINSKNIWDMSKITTQEAYLEHQDKKPFWEKLYLDVVLIIVGVSLWLIVKTQLSGTTAYDFAYAFGTTAPVLTILGSIMLITRLYPLLIQAISKATWKIHKLEIIGLATRRSSRRRSDVVRSLILITLTFTLIFSSLVTIQSYRDFDVENAYYSIGSDILVRTVDITNNDTLNTVKEIEGVYSATYLKFTSQIVTYGDLTYSYIVLGIDPIEFAKTAYFDNEYLRNQNPEEFFGAIQTNTEAAMQRDQLDKIETYTGENVTIFYTKYQLGDTQIAIQIVGIYDYFPRFYTAEPDPNDPIFRFNIVCNYDLLEELAYSDFSIAGDLLVKVADGYEITDVAAEIESTLHRSVDNVVDLTKAQQGSLRNTMLFGSLNATFISSLVITISAIILMILLQVVENEREVVTLKILGMSPKQLFSMFLSEAMAIVIFGAIVGSSIGIFAAVMFKDVLTFSIQIPRSEMVFQPLELTLAVSLLFFTAIFAAALTSYIVFRKDTIKAIKQI